ncbi:MAG: peptide deformylase [Oscillospiraceae bacterium]|nr:peptide deformylase [Oscillospiraceae bacterium]
MALRNVIVMPDETLTKKSRDVTAFDDKLWVLLDDLLDTLANHEGVGIAAVQVGILRKVIVIDMDDMDSHIELINPEIAFNEGNQREIEGCLSAPGAWGYVERPDYIKIKYQNRYGKILYMDATDLLAIAICHEIDHLNGVMFSDVASEMLDREPTEEELGNRPGRRRRKGKRRRGQVERRRR